MPSSRELNVAGGACRPRVSRWRGRLLAAAAAVPLAIAAVQVGLLADRSRHDVARPVAQPVQPPVRHEPADAAEWPNLFGPRHDSSTPQAVDTRWSESGPPELWRAVIGAGYSSPVVAGGRVVAVHRIGDDELVTAFEPEQGGTIWEHRRPTSFVCASHYTSGPYSTPAIADGRVITLGAQGRLECLDLDTGRLLWSRETGAEFDVPTGVFGAGHSPRVWRDLAILNIGGRTPDSGVIAFDVQSGDIRWQATAQGASFATPVLSLLHGRERAIVLTADALVVIDPADGRIVAEFPCASNVPDGYSAVTPVVAEDLILVSIFGYGTVCLRLQPDETLVTVWEDRRALTSQYNPLLSADGAVYGIHATDKSFRCIDLLTGKVNWRWKSPLGRSTHLIAGNHVLLFGEFGELGAIELNREECVPTAVVSATIFDGQRCFSAPALADGRLYLRNEGALVCLDLRPH